MFAFPRGDPGADWPASETVRGAGLSVSGWLARPASPWTPLVFSHCSDRSWVLPYSQIMRLHAQPPALSPTPTLPGQTPRECSQPVTQGPCLLGSMSACPSVGVRGLFLTPDTCSFQTLGNKLKLQEPQDMLQLSDPLSQFIIDFYII